MGARSMAIPAALTGRRHGAYPAPGSVRNFTKTPSGPRRVGARPSWARTLRLPRCRCHSDGHGRRATPTRARGTSTTAPTIDTLQEVEYLAAWLEQHPEPTAEWPAKVLIERIGRVMADGKMDADEEGDLLKLLLQFVNGALHDEAAPMESNALPLDDPPPPVVFRRQSFCLTGRFACGTRREVENTIKELRGNVTP